MSRRWLAPLAVVILALLPVLSTLRAAFVYDDTMIIRDNAWLRGWPALLAVWGEPYWPTSTPDALGLYRPLHIALLSVVWNVSHGSALAFHLYALALAGLTSLAVWWLLRRATSAAAALIAALWFAVHPLHVEAVASVANSSELLVVLCSVALVALLSRNEHSINSPEPWPRALLVALVATAALLSKESGLFALPLALVTVWGWRAATADRAAWREVLRANARGIGLACLGIAAALVARSLVLGAPVSRTSIAAQGLELGAAARALTMLSLWPHIAGMLAWPTTLSPYYGPTMIPQHTNGLALASALVALTLLALAVLRARGGERRPLVALAWVVLTYLPASNLLVATGQILSDRTLFGATAGVALALAWLMDALPRVGRRLAMVVVVLGILVSTVVTTRYALAWTSHRALWSHLVRVQPAEHLGYKLLGMDARARGEHERALVLLERAQAMAPSDRQIRFEYGQAQYEAGHFDDAATTLGHLLRDDDVRADAGFVSLYLEAVGRARGADAVIVAARPLLASASGSTAALYTGLAHERLGHLAAADSAYAAGLRVTPHDSALLARRAALEGIYHAP